MRRLILLGLLVVGPLALPGAASALTVSSQDLPLSRGPDEPFVQLSDPDGVNDDVTVSTEGDDLVVRTAPAPVAGEGCHSSGPGEVRCRAVRPASIVASLGDGDDQIAFGPLSGRVVFSGVRIYGDAGDDSAKNLTSVFATWDGGPGADTSRGARLTTDYSQRTAPIAASFDGVANDGEPGEGDDVGAEGGAVGGTGNDDLVAGPAGATLDGGLGDDRLTGGAGADLLSGGSGTNVLAGLGGDDLLQGGGGRSVLLGGEGDDRLDAYLPLLEGGELDGGPGDDRAVVSGGYGGNDAVDLRAAGYRSLEQVELSTVLLPGRLTGSAAGERLTLRGAAGSRLDGGGGDDVLISGGTFDHSIRIVGGPGRDEVVAEHRDDRIELRDRERDVVHCARGLITVPELDRIDVLDGCGPPVEIFDGRVDLTRRRVSAVVRCPRPGREPCHGRLILRAGIYGPKPLRVARLTRAFTLASREERRVSIRFGPRTAATLRRARSTTTAVGARTERTLRGQRSPAVSERTLDLHRVDGPAR